MRPQPLGLSLPVVSAPASEADDWVVQRVIVLVARERDVPVRLLLHESRCRAGAARARQVAMYLAHVVFGVSLTTIGGVFGRDRSTVSHACGLIEDLRDNPDFDAELDRLELKLANRELCDV